MVRSAFMFLIISLVTGISGFAIIEGSAAVIAKTLFFISLVLLMVSLLSIRASRGIDS